MPCRRRSEDVSTISDDSPDRTAQHWSPSAGYLSSFVALETGVGLQSCPWLVDVPPGRQVNVTVLRFSEQHWMGEGGAGGVTLGCEWTIVIREDNVTTHLPGCSGFAGRGSAVGEGDGRRRVFYTSRRRGTSLAIHLRPTAASTITTLRSQLLLYFQGSPRRLSSSAKGGSFLTQARNVRNATDITQE